MRKLIPMLVAVSGIAATLPQPADAHPHVWVDARSAVLFDEAGAMIGVRHRWTFDEMFGAFATQGLDADGDGQFTREELQPLAQVNVESLNEFDFFTFLDLGDSNGVFVDPVDYWLDYDGTRLTLHFTLPLETPLMMDARTVSIEVYDPTFFVDFALAETETAELVDAPDRCTLEIERAGDLDDAVAVRLAEIPADTREVPAELLEFTAGNSNAIHVSCR